MAHQIFSLATSLRELRAEILLRSLQCIVQNQILALQFPFFEEKCVKNHLKSTLRSYHLRLRKKSVVNFRLTLSISGKASMDMFILTTTASPSSSLGMSSLA